MAIECFICLANSRKLRGRCVAGVRSSDRSWFRPISATPEGTLFAGYQYADGTEARFFDEIELDVMEPRPDRFQPENCVISTSTWRLLRRVPNDEAHALVDAIADTGPNLFGDRSASVPEGAFDDEPCAGSLAVIAPRSTEWARVFRVGRGPQVRCRFELAGAYYDLPVTDPVTEDAVAGLESGWHSRLALPFNLTDRLLLTVSLAEPYEGECWKLVAGVIALPKR